nr:ATP-binding protein [Deinococcota bacterium]
GGLSILARLTAYSGLCLLIDEAESYSLLQARQRSKADHFFRAVIYAALHNRGTSIREDTLPQHHLRDYPAVYGDGQSLFFLFTVTRSDNRLPLEDWLEADEIIELDPHHTPQEISQFLHKLQGYHAQAYGYEPEDRQGQLRRAAAEHLAQGMRNAQLSIRDVVRLGVELYDLLYLYPDYEVAVLLEELRGQLR